MPQVSKPKKCIKCNLEFSSKYTFCTQCGQELKKINTCPSCDSQLNEKSKFCPNCGSDLNHLGSQIVNSYQEKKSNFQLFPQQEPVYSKNIKKIVFILLGIGFLIYLFLGGSFGTPTCEKIASGFSAYDGWHWGRPDRLPGYCNLPNSNEKIYYSN